MHFALVEFSTLFKDPQTWKKERMNMKNDRALALSETGRAARIGKVVAVNWIEVNQTPFRTRMENAYQ